MRRRAQQAAVIITTQSSGWFGWLIYSHASLWRRSGGLGRRLVDWLFPVKVSRSLVLSSSERPPSSPSSNVPRSAPPFCRNLVAQARESGRLEVIGSKLAGQSVCLKVSALCTLCTTVSITRRDARAARFQTEKSSFMNDESRS